MYSWLKAVQHRVCLLSAYVKGIQAYAGYIRMAERQMSVCPQEMRTLLTASHQ